MNAMLAKVGKVIVKNRRMILTVTSMIGVGVTMLVTAKAAVKAKEELDILEEDREDGLVEDDEYKKRKVVIVAKHAAAPVILGGLTCAAVGCNQHIATTEIAGALAGAEYVTKKCEKLEEKLREKLGDEAVDEAKTDICNEQAQEACQNLDMTSIVQIGKGQKLFFDELTGQLLRSDINELKDIAADFNRCELRDNDWICINYWLDYIGLHRMNEYIGETYGFAEKYDKDGLTLRFEPGNFVLPNGETPTIMRIVEHPCTEGDFRSVDTY